jgi:alpha-L-arabinofuranosidase
MSLNANITIFPTKEIARINPNLFGHFAEHLGTCIYEGIWVGEDAEIPNIRGMRIDVIEALKKINPPVLRWPGGCFADDYHWRNGIGPREKRPTTINLHWDSLESNQFGTHEFLDFCDLIDTEPYICGNMGSGSVSEMRDWLEYLNFNQDSSLAKLRKENGHPAPYGIVYWGVGNENWGCGGDMNPEYYANEFKRYSSYLHSFHSVPLYRIACGPNSFDYDWTKRFFANLAGADGKNKSKLHMVDGFAFHYYYGTAGSATEYNELEWYALIMKVYGMEELIQENRKIMDKYDPLRRIGLICDEWGNWHKPLPGTPDRWLKQQNTIRDAIMTAMTFDVFNRNADKIVMANIAQTINVLQSMILTDGPKMIVTPTYHVYEMYKEYQNALAISTKIECPDVGSLEMPMISGSAAIKDNKLFVSIVNIDMEKTVKIDLKLDGDEDYSVKTWTCLASEDIHDHNTFDNPEKVKPITKKIDNLDIELPAASTNVIVFEKK